MHQSKPDSVIDKSIGSSGLPEIHETVAIVNHSNFMNFFGKSMNKIISLHEQLEN